MKFKVGERVKVQIKDYYFFGSNPEMKSITKNDILTVFSIVNKNAIRLNHDKFEEPFYYHSDEVIKLSNLPIKVIRKKIYGG